MKQWQGFGLQNTQPLYSSLGLTPPLLRKAQGDAALNVISSVNYLPELDTPANCQGSTMPFEIDEEPPKSLADTVPLRSPE